MTNHDRLHKPYYVASARGPQQNAQARGPPETCIKNVTRDPVPGKWISSMVRCNLQLDRVVKF